MKEKTDVEVTVHQSLRIAILFLMCALYPCVITTHKNESNKHVKA
jgi:hypothetical protein